MVHAFKNHQKNITSLCMDGSGTRVLSAGLGVYSMYPLYSGYSAYSAYRGV